MQEIVDKCFMAINKLMANQTSENVEEVLKLSKDYNYISEVSNVLEYVAENYSSDYKHSELSEQVLKLLNLRDLSEESLEILNELGLPYNGEEFIDILDIASSKGLDVSKESHPIFNNISGDIDNLIYVHTSDENKEDIYEDLESLEFSYKSHSFVFVLMRIGKESYVLGVNKKENIIIFSTLQPLVGNYRIKNKRKVDKTTYKGVVFPNYNGKDKYVIDKTIVDREYLIGAVGFLESLGVLLR